MNPKPIYPPTALPSRRVFLRDGTLFLAASNLGLCSFASEDKPALEIGLVTDLHYADKPTGGSRYYQETLRSWQRLRRFSNAGSRISWSN